MSAIAIAGTLFLGSIFGHCSLSSSFCCGCRSTVALFRGRSALGALAFCEAHGCGFGPPRVLRAVAICTTQGLHECPDLRREKAPVRVNGVQPNLGKDLPIEQHWFEPACIDFGRE